MKEKSFTKNNKQTRDLNVGWYSEDDMVKVLKWNKFLGLKQFAVEHISLNFTIFLGFVNMCLIKLYLFILNIRTNTVGTILLTAIA